MNSIEETEVEILKIKAALFDHDQQRKQLETLLQARVSDRQRHNQRERQAQADAAAAAAKKTEEEGKGKPEQTKA